MSTQAGRGSVRGHGTGQSWRVPAVPAGRGRKQTEAFLSRAAGFTHRRPASNRLRPTLAADRFNQDPMTEVVSWMTTCVCVCTLSPGDLHCEDTLTAVTQSSFLARCLDTGYRMSGMSPRERWNLRGLLKCVNANTLLQGAARRRCVCRHHEKHQGVVMTQTSFK